MIPVLTVVAGYLRSACMSDAFDGALPLLCQVVMSACAFW